MSMTRRFTVHELRPTPPASAPAPATVSQSAVAAKTTKPAKPAKPKETGGPSGPEPTRYGDWERKGICVDF